MKKTIRIIILIVALSILAFSSYKVVDYKLETKSSTDLVEEVAEEHTVVVDGELRKVNFKTLESVHSDVVAWLYQKDTNINYPVAQSKDNEYYLRRLLNGEHNMNGTLFMDYRNSADFSDYITMIYGHNMKNGEMFATFPQYAKQKYFDAHPEMKLYTPSGNYTVKLFAGFLTDDRDEIYSFTENSMGAKEIFEKAISKSSFKSPITEYNGEKILILSTCSYEKSNSRFVLLGILVK